MKRDFATTKPSVQRSFGDMRKLQRTDKKRF
jgi:hypothetical protein